MNSVTWDCALAIAIMLCGYWQVNQSLKRRGKKPLTPIVLFVMLGLLWIVQASPNDSGWTVSQQQLPETFVFISGTVEEPTVTNQGGIWVLLRTDERRGEPHVVQVPFTPGLASDILELNKAVKALNQEIPVTSKQQAPRKTTDMQA